MAKFTSVNPEEEQKDNGGAPLSFKEAMAAIFGQSVDDYGFSIPGINDNGADWIDKFVMNSASTKNKLICDLPFLNPAVMGIEISNDQVDGELTGSPEEKMFKALVMTMAAKANKDMREDGVNIVGNSPTEEAFLFLAAYILELPVKNATPEMQQNAGQIAETVKAQELWQSFSGQMHEFEASTPDSNNASKKKNRSSGLDFLSDEDRHTLREHWRKEHTVDSEGKTDEQIERSLKGIFKRAHKYRNRGTDARHRTHEDFIKGAFDNDSMHYNDAMKKYRQSQSIP